MLAPWAKEEMEHAVFKDRRLNYRLTRLLSDLGERPQASIPAACGGHAETAAAYRFFDHELATPEAVLQSHFERTRQRMAEQPVVLLVQDTTELDLTRPHQQVAGAGPLKSASQRGALLHPLEAFTPDGTPLGAVWAQMWTRDDEPVALSREEKQRLRRKAPFETKESFRWVEALRAAREVAQQVPQTTFVCIGDSEADIYELFQEPRGATPVHWLIRAAQNDRLLMTPQEKINSAPGAETSDSDQSGSDEQRLRAAVLASPVLFQKEISIRGRDQKIKCKTGSRDQPRESRTAQVEVRAKTVQLCPPDRARVKLAPVTINVVLVREIDPPAGDVPVEWLLLTTLPIESAEQVRQIVQYYTVRFMIEVLFRVLKSGCRVEERRFEHIDRLLPCVAVYLIVAWRTLMVCRLGRSSPELDCEAIFEPAEWKSVWMVVKRGPPPTTPPKLGVMIRLVAQLGGYVNHPGRTDPPGPQTVWLGLQRTRDLAWAWTTFGPGAPQPP
jgi:Transposase DNA-binding/Transposase Tn5 dimerisation domain/Transposase DDE domain